MEHCGVLDPVAMGLSRTVGSGACGNTVHRKVTCRGCRAGEPAGNGHRWPTFVTMSTAPGGAVDWGAVDWDRIDAVLFDLDGVLTPTATIHERAWKETFDAFLRRRAAATGEPFAEFTVADYLATVDGKPRFDGVRGFLSSRDIHLPDGDPSDAPGDGTVCAVGNTKNDTFRTVLRRDGIAAYPGSVLLLDWLAERGCAVAVVSSSRNAPEVLDAAGLAQRFGVVVDGNVTAALGLAGKPAPDMFIEGARRVGVPIGRTMVVEDALVGVAAGRAGSFGIVVGVDRGAGHAALIADGAHLVVDDLAELILGDHASESGGAVGSGTSVGTDGEDSGDLDDAAGERRGNNQERSS